MPVIVMLNDARENAVEADETKAAHDLLGPEFSCEKIFVAPTVLQSEENSSLMQ
jgi:hypothetical protein